MTEQPARVSGVDTPPVGKVLVPFDVDVFGRGIDWHEVDAEAADQYDARRWRSRP